MILIKQKTIEYFFKKHKIDSQSIRVGLLSQVTELVYEYNIGVVRYDQETDEYKKKQIESDVKYAEERIAKILENSSKK